MQILIYESFFFLLCDDFSDLNIFQQKRVSAERCAELTIVAATHGLKEAWISYQVVLFPFFIPFL